MTASMLTAYCAETQTGLEKAARALDSVFQVLCKAEPEPPKFRPSFEIATTFPSSSPMHKFQRVDTATCLYIYAAR